MIENNILTKFVKTFMLVQFNEAIKENNKLNFIIDEEKTAFCLGIVIDGFAIALGANKMYPTFEYSEDTELNTYYVLNTFEYGEKIPTENGYIIFEDDPSELEKKYLKTIKWYYNEVIECEKRNVINFEKGKVLLLK